MQVSGLVGVTSSAVVVGPMVVSTRLATGFRVVDGEPIDLRCSTIESRVARP